MAMKWKLMWTLDANGAAIRNNERGLHNLQSCKDKLPIYAGRRRLTDSHFWMRARCRRWLAGQFGSWVHQWGR